jgi:hypothetical protein
MVSDGGILASVMFPNEVNWIGFDPQRRQYVQTKNMALDGVTDYGSWLQIFAYW